MAVIALGSCAGCGSAGPDSVGSSHFAILGGEPSTSEYDGVVLLTLDGSDLTPSSCTGTLISPVVVVTAKHCVWPQSSGAFVCSGAGDLIDEGSGAGTFGPPLAPETIAVHVGVSALPEEPVAHVRRILAAPTEHTCRDDIAVLILDTPVEDVLAFGIYRSGTLRAGESVKLLGYGEETPSGVYERRVVRDARIAEVGATGTEEEHASPSTPAHTFVLAGTTTCLGDSGGPALNEQDEIVGVYSRKAGDCLAAETWNTYVIPADYAHLVDEALAETTDPSALTGEDDGGANGAGEAAADASAGAGGVGQTSEPAALAPDAPKEERLGSSDGLRCQLSAQLFASQADRPRAYLSPLWAALSLLFWRRQRQRRACAGEGCPGAPGA